MCTSTNFIDTFLQVFAPNTVQVEIEFNGTPEQIVPRLLKCLVQMDTHQRMPTNVSIYSLIYIDCNQFVDSKKSHQQLQSGTYAHQRNLHNEMKKNNK